VRIDDADGVLVRSADGVGVFSVNKKLGSLSNLGHGFCMAGTRISPEVWVADFAMSGWLEMALGPRELRLVSFEWQSGVSVVDVIGAVVLYIEGRGGVLLRLCSSRGSLLYWECALT